VAPAVVDVGDRRLQVDRRLLRQPDSLEQGRGHVSASWRRPFIRTAFGGARATAAFLFVVLNARTTYEENRMLNLLGFAEGYHRTFHEASPLAPAALSSTGRTQGRRA